MTEQEPAEDDRERHRPEDGLPDGSMATDGALVAGDDGSVVPLAGGLPDTGGATLRDVDPAYGRRDITGVPTLPQDRDEEPG